jgi:ubiquinone/menaquinone biosynthesis C-methylase UbiE
MHQHGLRSATVLDIGTGSADIPQRLTALAQRRGFELEVFALDLSERHLQIAREHIANDQHIHLVRADAFRLPFADHSIDVVTASLFAHHFRPPQLSQLLHEFARVARYRWFINDLVRHRVPLGVFRLTRPIFARSYLTRHDGEASIRRGYTVEELKQFVAQGKIDNARVDARFPYRVSITGDKNICPQSGPDVS